MSVEKLLFLSPFYSSSDSSRKFVCTLLSSSSMAFNLLRFCVNCEYLKIASQEDNSDNELFEWIELEQTELWLTLKVLWTFIHTECVFLFSHMKNIFPLVKMFNICLAVRSSHNNLDEIQVLDITRHHSSSRRWKSNNRWYVCWFLLFLKWNVRGWKFY